MKKEERLTKPPQYSLVYRKGSSHASPLLVLRAMPNGLPVSRFGFSVSKKVGNAVVRNRLKRQLREISPRMPLRSSSDVVIIVRPPAANADFATLKKTVESLLSRAGMLKIEAGIPSSPGNGKTEPVHLSSTIPSTGPSANI